MPILNEEVILKPLERLYDLQRKLNILVGECMMEHKEEILLLLVNQHTSSFVDSSGRPLRTVIRKYVFDFSDNIQPFRLPEGLTKSSAAAQLQLIVDGEEYNIISDSMTFGGRLKTDWLTKWNEAEIMDLAPESRKKVWDIILPTFKEKSANELRG